MGQGPPGDHLERGRFLRSEHRRLAPGPRVQTLRGLVTQRPPRLDPAHHLTQHRHRLHRARRQLPRTINESTNHQQKVSRAGRQICGAAVDVIEPQHQPARRLDLPPHPRRTPRQHTANPGLGTRRTRGSATNPHAPAERELTKRNGQNRGELRITAIRDRLHIQHLTATVPYRRPHRLRQLAPHNTTQRTQTIHKKETRWTRRRSRRLLQRRLTRPPAACGGRENQERARCFERGVGGGSGEALVSSARAAPPDNLERQIVVHDVHSIQCCGVAETSVRWRAGLVPPRPRHACPHHATGRPPSSARRLPGRPTPISERARVCLIGGVGVAVCSGFRPESGPVVATEWLTSSSATMPHARSG